MVLVGVCCTEGPDGRDPYAEISVQPLPDYTISSDGVTMTCVTCTNKGRIFMAGRDGHIYELLYTTGSGYHKRCRKVCLTAGVGSMISRYMCSLCLVFFCFLCYLILESGIKQISSIRAGSLTPQALNNSVVSYYFGSFF